MSSQFEPALLNLITDKIRALKMELVKEAPVRGYWIYEFHYYEDEEVKSEHIMGKDMSDALYRFTKINDMPFSKFSHLPK